MEGQFSRTELLLGAEALETLANKRVAIFGVGGVGGYVCEALVRSGIGEFDICDDDKVALSNLNRQIIATHKSVGRYKVDVMKERMLDINPEVKVNTYQCFFLPENADQFPFEEFDYVVDAVDTVTAKLEIIMRAKEKNVPVISAMGAGNKLDPTKFVITDIYKTSMDPLAKVMRRELKKRGIKDLKVVYSEEIPIKPNSPKNVTKDSDSEEKKLDVIDKSKEVEQSEPQLHARRSTPGSVSFVPSVAGLIIASEVVKDLIS
ncbi:tRNA threonylcarbamoyladenosine dehydratase [Butyrivibrio sp. YAB3001]|uniref:tRNA threonylcarbamoyladenosine dehydratase n=1 Tax=Butyrivibrio sp. YAB3001 TaxID=1520812 RepID=UPI0008F66BC4|nr:tRNA threonylcarbamoyladenosine dehydratase [Butyrivibrio sp. YAB3001]SFB97849.1 tRNA A37 threonylcarbamoyladenosine dehydratase [Butyrivibrio sp. YAB3001]